MTTTDTTSAYQLDQVMLPRGQVHHLRLTTVHPDVWAHLAGRSLSYRPVPLDNLPFGFCALADRDGLIPHTGRRRLCATCEDSAADFDYRVDELRWSRLMEIAWREPDDPITRAFRAKVGW